MPPLKPKNWCGIFLNYIDSSQQDAWKLHNSFDYVSNFFKFIIDLEAIQVISVSIPDVIASYTVSQKRDPYTFPHILAKYWPIFKFFSTLN
jgi:hypothetical protein